jgi:hypothetical protein
MYQASGIFAPLTKTEMIELDRHMLSAWRTVVLQEDWRTHDTYDTCVRDEIIDIRRDLNAEWGNR